MSSNETSDPASGDKGQNVSLPEPVLKSVSEIFSYVSFKVTEELRGAEQMHAAALREALVAVRTSVRRELTDEIRQGFDERFRQSVEEAKEQFRRKLAEKSGSKGSPAELAKFKESVGAVTAELTGKEAELAHLERETALMIDDPDIEISKIVHNNAAITELRAYIKGLRFQADSSQKAT